MTEPLIQLTITAEELDTHKTTTVRGRAKDVKLVVESTYPGTFDPFEWGTAPTCVTPREPRRLSLTGEWIDEYRIELFEHGLAAEVERLRAAVTRVRARHTRDARLGHDDERCASCTEEAWPCPTVRALDGEA